MMMDLFMTDRGRHQAGTVKKNRRAFGLEKSLLSAVIASVLFGAAASAQTYTYSYDEIGRLVVIERQNGATVTHRVYEYDNANNRLKAVGGTGPAPTLNSPPVANFDYFIHAVSATATVINLLANDTDPDGDPLQVISVTTPTWNLSGQPAGTLYDMGNGQFQYLCPAFYPPVMCDPFQNWNDQVLFDYTISDGRGGTATTTVVIEHQ